MPVAWRATTVIAVGSIRWRSGLAARLVEHAESRLIELGCPKVELMVRDSNPEVMAFYQAIGYRLEPVRVLSKRLQQDDRHDFI